MRKVRLQLFFLSYLTSLQTETTAPFSISVCLDFGTIVTRFRCWEEGTLKTTLGGGTSPPPPLFPAISAPEGGMTLAPSILTQRGELHLPVASKRGQMMQQGGLHPLVVSSFLFSTQRRSVDLLLCHLSFFNATGRCPPPRCVVFPFSDLTGKSAPSLHPSTLLPNTT